MDRLKGSKMEKKKKKKYIYTMPKQLVKTRAREKYISLSFLFIHLNSEAPSWQLNEKKAVMSWHDIWQIKGETSLTSIIF